MRAQHQSQTGVAVLRPWPFGPPLRGRAPHHDARMAASLSTHSHGLRPAPSASAGGGGRFAIPLLCAMKTISTNNQKVSNGNQDVTVLE